MGMTDLITLRVECCVCGHLKSEMQISRPKGFKGDTMISHGYCKPCADIVLEQIKQMGDEVVRNHDRRN